MFGQLGSFRRRCQGLTQGFALRGLATQRQGRRQQPEDKRFGAGQPTPPPPPRSPEKIEWWAVDGELFKAEKFDPKRVLAPLENEHISNKRRRRQLVKHLNQTRLKMKLHSQDSYWAAYMKRYQILREEWEKLVWDPIPVPLPKRRHPTWLAEETQKYVWHDPRREPYLAKNLGKDSNAFTFDVSQMDQSAIKSRFDEKIGYKGQSMGNSPYENQRHPGASGYSFNRTGASRPGMTPLRHRSMDSHRNRRPPDLEDFEDVFAASNEDRSQVSMGAASPASKEGSSEEKIFNWSETDSDEVTGYEAAASEGDEVEVFDWQSEADSEDEQGNESYQAAARGNGNDDDDDDDDDEYETDDEGDKVGCTSESKDEKQKSQGWFGHEDDLFKDD